MRQVRSIAWAMLLTAAAALAQADSGATAACLGCHDLDFIGYRMQRNRQS